jgi:hypothetical protein
MNELDDEGRAARNVWQSQVLLAPRLTVQFVQHQSDRLDADRRREVRIGWAGLGACVLLVAALMWNPLGVVSAMTDTLRLTAVLLLLACAYLIHQLHQRSRTVSAQVEGVVGSLAAYRCELRRRRDLYHDAWKWSIWPALPALGVIFSGGALYDDRPGKLWRYGLCAVVAVIGIGLGIIHYRHKGDQFQRELDALASLEEE